MWSKFIALVIMAMAATLAGHFDLSTATDGTLFGAGGVVAFVADQLVNKFFPNLPKQ